MVLITMYTGVCRKFILQEKRYVEEHVQLLSLLPTMEETVLGDKVAERFKTRIGQQRKTELLCQIPAKGKTQ
jgi:hypothetical protein